MSFTRKYLTALGIEADKVDEIMSAHVEVVNGLKDEINANKADTAKLEAVEKELNQLKANKPVDPKESEEYKALKTEFDTYKTSVAEEKTNGIKSKACIKALTDLGINEKMAKLLVNAKDFDLSKYELDGENFKNAEEISKTFKETYADYIPEIHEQGADTEKPPVTGGGAVTVEQFNKMTYAERDKLYSENHALYEQLRDSAKEN